jgi:uncharacterized protein
LAIHYLDSSAIAKRYLPEIGSLWVNTLCDAGTVVSSTLSIVELSSAIARQCREGRLSLDQRDVLLQRMADDMQGYVIISLEAMIVERAARLVTHCPEPLNLRSLDALHLASALHAREQTPRIPLISFVSSDRRLLAAAEWAGLPAENPEDHA